MEVDQGQEQVLNEIGSKLGENWRDDYLPAIVGSIGEGWRETFLPEDSPLRSDPTLARIKNIQELSKTAVEQRATMGRWGTEKGILRPQEGAPQEEWDAFYTSLGRPEKPELYEIGKPENLPEGFPYSPELEAGFRQWAFEEGISATSAKNLFNKYVQANLAQYEQATKDFQKSVEALSLELKKEWGADKYQENFALAQNAMRQFAPEGSLELEALDRAIGDSPVLVKMFYEIGRRMGEGGFVKGGAATTSFLAARKQELLAHPAYSDKAHPEYQKVAAEMEEIYKKMAEEENKGNYILNSRKSTSL